MWPRTLPTPACSQSAEMVMVMVMEVTEMVVMAVKLVVIMM